MYAFLWFHLYEVSKNTRQKITVVITFRIIVTLEGGMDCMGAVEAFLAAHNILFIDLGIGI